MARKTAAHAQHLLLDLLVDGPSSFAGLFGSLCDRHSYVATSAMVDATLDALTEMTAKGWLRSRTMTATGAFTNTTDNDVRTARSRYREWLPNAAKDERAVDEIGLWYEITESGRDEWTQWSQDPEALPRWALDDDSVSRVVTVRAASLSDAEDALSTWAAQNPRIELVYETKEIAPLSQFRLRSGVLLTDGVTVTCGYRVD